MRIIKEGKYVSPTDGRVVAIEEVNNLPDIIENHKKYTNYLSITIVSHINNVYFKYAPCDGIIDEIVIFNPKAIDKNSNFLHKIHRTYISLHLLTENKEKIFIVVEVLFADKNYDLYTLYVEKGIKFKKGDVLLCVHFYSKLFLYIPHQPLQIQLNQSLFYHETLLA
jgi:hypothetical protein